MVVAQPDLFEVPAFTPLASANVPQLSQPQVPTVCQSPPPSRIDMLWSRRSHVGPLGAGEVDVWAAALDVPCDRQRRLAETLSLEEQRRAARFRSSEYRSRWTVGRGLLREILGHYLAVHPGQVRLGHCVHGKPRLAGQLHSPIAFNLARSGGLGVYALSSCYEVGVDAEELREFPEMRPMANRIFSPAERAFLTAAPPATYLPAFYRCWTCKEAYLKARGTGLLAPLDSFDVEVAADQPAALLRVTGNAEAPGHWTLVHLQPARSHVGALAVRAPPSLVSYRTGCWEERRGDPPAGSAGLPS